MRFPIFLGACVLIAAPVPAFAQDGGSAPDEGDLSVLTERLADPATQSQMTNLLTAVTQVLLDVKVAPLAQAVAEASGDDSIVIDPDQTLRDLAPEADQLPDTLEREIPRAMDQMAGMAGAMEAMLPALREMALKFERAIEDSALSRR
ncbi:hypothetical protein [Parerythrobacter jejuensis]|uniref:Uncharacterized protein n=1 Tax=Parerythrobacter jejuensis TaxID=795812 RepID=A0A845APC9_9SPHN|nr:hypothetical protein [Parerythrobacter jejuensis]MXP31299.1 hypothetical protein [Parerythrobacter jejuensis]MXP34059.1 hypothetical protein [Parerythrobacter jejuensis]